MGFFRKRVTEPDYSSSKYTFTFNTDPISTSDIQVLKNYKPRGNKYYKGSIVISEDEKPEGIVGHDVYFFLRVRYTKGINKQESIQRLISVLLKGEGEKFISKDHTIGEINPVILKGSVDYLIADIAEKRTIIHFNKEDINGATIEGFFVYDDESVTKEFKTFVTKNIV